MQRSTNAQIQMGEIIAVLFVFMLLLIFGLLWFFSLGPDASEIREERLGFALVEKTKEIMSLPELQCSVNSVPDTSCVDAYRVMALKPALKAGEDESTAALRDRYYGYRVQIRTLYPEETRFAPGFDVFDFPPPEDYGMPPPAIVPITLYDPLTERGVFSVLILTQYIEETGGPSEESTV